MTDTDTRPPRAAAAPARGRPRLRLFAERYAIVGIWLVMFVVFFILVGPAFASMGVVRTIFGSQTALVFLAAALLCTLIVSEFVDLAFAPVLGMSATLVPVLYTNVGLNLVLACVIAIAAAMAAYAVIAYVVVIVGVGTIVVTLGMSTLVLGLTQWASNLTTVGGLPREFADISVLPVLGLPIAFYYGVALMAVFAYVLGYTALGRQMRFIGANREVARLSGVRVDRIRFGSFIVAGLICGVGGVLVAAAVGGFDPNTSHSYLLPTFAAVFLGTAVIRPGLFNPIGALVGIYFLATGILGLQLLGLGGWISNVFYGAALVIAVTISTVLQRRRKRGR
jgi:ribose transport system permease protein